MYELIVRHEFCAAHAIVIRGQREPVHGHNWRVAVAVGGPALDADGLLCDFHDVERTLRAAAEPFTNRDLNATPPFDRLNPTAEHVAKHFAEAVAKALPEGVRVLWASVTEAPGCEARYIPD